MPIIPYLYKVVWHVPIYVASFPLQQNSFRLVKARDPRDFHLSWRSSELVSAWSKLRGLIFFRFRPSPVSHSAPRTLDCHSAFVANPQHLDESKGSNMSQLGWHEELEPQAAPVMHDCVQMATRFGRGCKNWPKQDILIHRRLYRSRLVESNLCVHHLFHSLRWTCSSYSARRWLPRVTICQTQCTPFRWTVTR